MPFIVVPLVFVAVISTVVTIAVVLDARKARRRAGRQRAERALKTMPPDQVARWVRPTDRSAFDEGIRDAVQEHYEANPHLDH